MYFSAKIQMSVVAHFHFKSPLFGQKMMSCKNVGFPLDLCTLCCERHSILIHLSVLNHFSGPLLHVKIGFLTIEFLSSSSRVDDNRKIKIFPVAVCVLHEWSFSCQQLFSGFTFGVPEKKVILTSQCQIKRSFLLLMHH